MTRQSSSIGWWHRAGASRRRDVEHGSALLLWITVVLAGCASDERLSLGRHQPASPLPPAFGTGQAGSAAVDMDEQAGDPPESDIGSPEPVAPPVQPEPAAPFMPRHDSAMSGASHDAGVAAPRCAAGTYAADLVCAVDPATLPPGSDPRASMPMRTAVSFTVEPAVTPEWLEIRSGTLMFQYMGLSFVGRLSGGLDCASSEFHADIVDGSYASLFSGAQMPGPFEGEVDGRLDPAEPMLAGSWWHGPANAPAGAPSCVGPWTARLQPP